MMYRYGGLTGNPLNWRKLPSSTCVIRAYILMHSIEICKTICEGSYILSVVTVQRNAAVYLSTNSRLSAHFVSLFYCIPFKFPSLYTQLAMDGIKYNFQGGGTVQLSPSLFPGPLFQ